MKANLPIGRAWGLFFGGALAVLLAVSLQACTGAATPLPSAGPVATLGPNSTEQPAKITAPRDATLRVAVQPIVQIDPAFISSDPEVLVASQVYDYLVDLSVDNQVVPALAREWQISPDLLQYTFTLEDGVKFQDGSPLRADDVVWTFERLRDPNGDLPTKEIYTNVESIQAADDQTVVFKLKETDPFFLYDLSDNHALIMKAGSTDPAQFNGTGPFRVAQYLPEDRIVLEANPDYFIPGQPAVGRLEIIFFPDSSAMVDALRGGQVDLVFLSSATDLYNSLLREPGLEFSEVATNQFDLVRLRADRSPGNDPRVIQALRLATDRDEIFQLVVQGLGAIGRDSPIGPMYPQYYSEDTPLPERDVEAAKQLLAQAGYADGLNLELHTPDTGSRPNLAVALKEQWAEAGVFIDVIVEPESVYYGDNGWLEVDLGITGWGSRPYPQFYLDTMLACGAVWNEAHFCDHELDGLIRMAGTTPDEAERVQAYKEIQRILIERGPVIIPYFAAQFAAMRESFDGLAMKPFWGRTDLSSIGPSGK